MRDNSRWVPTPIVANGLMYVAEGSGRVLAFDVPTGEVVWIHTRTFPEDIASSEGYPRSRGVSIYGDTIYWGTADMHLVALDARSGQVRWDVPTGDYKTGEGHAHPPLIADGKVFIGAAGGDLAARGKFQARDAQTGALVWELYTVPRKGEPGFETWTPNEHWPPLGGAAWNTVSYDRELELVYFSDRSTDAVEHRVARAWRLLVYELRDRGRGRHRQDPLALPARARPTNGTAPLTRACSSIFGSMA